MYEIKMMIIKIIIVYYIVDSISRNHEILFKRTSRDQTERGYIHVFECV